MVTTPRLITMLAALLVTASAPALSQDKRPGPPPKKGLQAEAFTEKDIEVIVSPADNEIVSVVVGLEGGFASGETANPALADFTGDLVASSGSASYPKSALRRFLTETSTSLNGSGDYRGVTFTMTTTRGNFDRAWEVLSSLLLEPQLDEVEYRNIMQRRVADVQRRWSNPEAHASIIADSLVKLGNPVLGRTIQQPDVEGVTIAGVREYLQRLGERSRMLVVVVGKVSPDDMKKKLERFASLPAGSYKRPEIPPLVAAASPKVDLVDRPGTPTTYVQSSFVGPRADENDFWSLQIGLSHLRNVLFEELRTKRNLTYAPGSSLSSTLGFTRGTLSVSTTRPDSSIAVMYRELEKMRRGEFSEEELNASKQVFTTVYYMRQMTNAGIANAIYSSQRNTGDWRRAFSMDAITAVNKASVQQAFQKYARNLQVGIVGKKDAVTEDRFLFRQ